MSSVFKKNNIHEDGQVSRFKTCVDSDHRYVYMQDKMDRITGWRIRQLDFSYGVNCRINHIDDEAPYLNKESHYAKGHC